MMDILHKYHQSIISDNYFLIRGSYIINPSDLVLNIIDDDLFYVIYVCLINILILLLLFIYSYIYIYLIKII